MNLQTFFSNFELFADAPNGVQKLRELILQLAVQGKLVPQNPSDEPAAVLLEKIKEEKERLIKEGKIKKSKKLPPVDVGEMAFDLPQGWEWVRLGETAKIIEYGTSHKSVDAGETVPVFRMNNIQNGQITFNNLKYVPESIKDLPRLYLEFNDILFNRTNSYELVGKTGIFKAENNNKYTFASYLIRVSLFYDYLNPEFVNISMNSCYFRQTQIEPEITQQCGQANFNGTKLKNSIIPLPPLNEQHRIVAKVDALMKLCDELETRSQNKRDRILQLGQVATTKLTTPSSKESFNQQWKTISDNFDLLYSTPENVKQLRQAILQLAVMGKLVPQNPEDEPAAVLLEKIKEEKERLIKEKKIQKSKQLPLINKDEYPFTTSLNWEWVKIDHLCFVTKLAGFEYTKHINLAYDGEVPVIRAQNVRMNKIDNSNLRFIDLATSKLLERSALTKPAILMTFIGAGIGDVAILNSSQRWHLAPNVAKLEPFNNIHENENIDINYLLIFLMSPTGRSEIFKYRKSTAQPSLSMGTIRDINVILPPLNEQHRIVTKVNQMMSLCDELEAKLTQSINDREKLMSAAVRQVLAV